MGLRTESTNPTNARRSRMKKVTIISNIVGRGAEGIPVSATGGAAGAGVDLSGLLRKSVWDSVFEIKTDANGVSYILSKLNFVSQRGITAFGDPEGLAIGSIYDGLPIDNRTIYWDNGVLKAKGGEGGGGGVADSVAWVDVYGKPSWITENKPVYAYSEILNAPTMPTALSQLANDMGFVTEGTVNALRDIVAGKQDAITDLDAIRSGAALGATAVQRGESVAHAVSADSANLIKGVGGGLLDNVQNGMLQYSYSFEPGANGLFPATNWANAVINIGRHSGKYNSQLGFSSNGKLYYRVNKDAQDFDASDAWKELAFTSSKVASAANADNAANATTAQLSDKSILLQGVKPSGGDFSGSDLTHSMRLYGPIDRGTANLFPHDYNANMVLTINKHQGNYNSQLGFSSNGKLYYRNGGAEVLTTQSWKQIAFTDTKVDSATSADDASFLVGRKYPGTTLDGVAESKVRYDYAITSASKAMFPNKNNANSMLTFNRYPGKFYSQLGFSSDGNLYYRINKSDYDISANDVWKQLAFTDSNVESATKLQTPRKIWGQDFDGSADVNGNATISGDTSLGGKLNVSGNTTLGGNVVVSGTALISGHSLRCRVLRDGANQWIIGKVDDVDGAIGIGSVNSTQPVKLENLNGNAVLGSDGNFSVSKGVNVRGNILVGGGVTMYSQRSLKNVVDERGLSLDELATIKPTRYTWKDGRDERVHIGGIADDVERVMPEVVRRTKDGVLTMDYACAAFAMSASLIQPVSEHERRIGELERENIALREELELLRKGA